MTSKPIQKFALRDFAFFCVTLSCVLPAEIAAADPPRVQLLLAQQNTADRKEQGQSGTKVDWTEHLPADAIRSDLKQFHDLLKSEWLVATLSDADFDGAVARLAKRSNDGMKRSDFLFELQQILALGNDGHAEMTQLAGALHHFREDQGFLDFVVDLCGDDYVAYRVEHVPDGGKVNSRYDYRFKLVAEEFPYLSEIDGVPIDRWVETISRFVPKGPDLSVRWRCMQWIGYLPFWRHQMGLSQSGSVQVHLTSRDKLKRMKLEAVLGTNPPHHFHIPKPDWRIIDKEFGYVWIRNPAAGGSKVIVEAMPQLRDTKGLIIDLRGNIGGSGLETLQLMAAYLLRPDAPRRVVGSEVQWSGQQERTTDRSFAPDDRRLSEAGKKSISDYQAGFKPLWNPPRRSVQWRHTLLARPEAEPEIYPYNVPGFPVNLFYHYSAPVVVLMDHRNFSAAELFLAGIRALDNVTLVGSPTTSAGGTSPTVFKLEKSGLEFMAGSNHSFVRTNGEFIDGRGIRPDIVVFPDIDYYLGSRDRMLETAIDVLKKRITIEK